MGTNVLDGHLECGAADKYLNNVYPFKCSLMWEKSIECCNLFPCSHSSNNHHLGNSCPLSTPSPSPPPPLYTHPPSSRFPVITHTYIHTLYLDTVKTSVTRLR